MREGKDFKPADLNRVRTHSIHGRKTKVSVRQFASAPPPHAGFAEFIGSLPDVLAASNLKRVIRDIVSAKKKGRPIVAALGGHVVKCGLGPVLVDLMERGFITAVAMHGATAIHDYEISLVGRTSEDVATVLKDGSFGMAREAPAAFKRAAEEAAHRELGLGKSLGKLILSEETPCREHSVLAAAARLGLPAAVLLALGTDTICMHPDFCPDTLARASHLDFRILVSVVSRLEGGVWMNIGSAVVLPEVFLKALSLARNLGSKVEKFTAVNLDMRQHYRPNTNVVGRSTRQGYSITGHHEIMLPLLRMGIISAAERKTK